MSCWGGERARTWRRAQCRVVAHSNSACHTLGCSFPCHETDPDAVCQGRIQAPDGFNGGSPVRVTLERGARR
jgi:hypothetical protein